MDPAAAGAVAGSSTGPAAAEAALSAVRGGQPAILAARRAAATLRALADDVRGAGARARRAGALDWRSPAAGVFRDRLRDCEQDVGACARRLDAAAQALEAHAATATRRAGELEQLWRSLTGIGAGQ